MISILKTFPDKKNASLTLESLEPGSWINLTAPSKEEMDTVSRAAKCPADFLAAALDPETLINELNTLFTAFDRIVEANHCERMKTIGDAYLFVAGLPEPSDRHVHNAAAAALELIDYLRQRNRDAAQQWQVRIGLHCGPVVGGIVGSKKYLYDIFGDTVNIAARLEALSEPMRINVSADVCRMLADEFVFSCPLNVEMKGKGLQSTCFLEGRQKS